MRPTSRADREEYHDRIRARDPIPGQMSLVDVQPVDRAKALPPGKVPVYEDVVLTAEEMEEAKERWPDATPKNQIHYMRMKIWGQWRHSIIIDEKTGRRAFGGPQPRYRDKEKRRIDEQIVEAADDRSGEIIDAVFSALDSRNSDEVRHKAGVNIAKLAIETKRVQIKEDALERASAADLKIEAAKAIVEMLKRGELDMSDIEGLVDGTAEEIEAPRQIAS